MFCCWCSAPKRIFLEVSLLNIFRRYARAEVFVERYPEYEHLRTPLEKRRLHFTKIRNEWSQTAVQGTWFKSIFSGQGLLNPIHVCIVGKGNQFVNTLCLIVGYAGKRNHILGRILNQFGQNLSVTTELSISVSKYINISSGKRLRWPAPLHHRDRLS